MNRTRHNAMNTDPTRAAVGRRKNESVRAENERRYNRGYYHGENSGYPAEGYRAAHPDWSAWLDLISQIKPPPARLFDSGAAFGYLPGAASERGYSSFGCDISSYALHQEPELQKLLFQGTSEELPLRAQSFDLVCLFDVLEHLENPVQALEEAVRILGPDGVLAGATPDPVFFQKNEETHCFERSPSFWIHHLRKLGLKVVFRFSNIPENFQFLAAPETSRAAEAIEIFQHDYFSHDPDIIALGGGASEGLSIALRDGWSTLDSHGRKIEGREAAVYILNEQSYPVDCEVEIEFSDASQPAVMQVRFNSLVLERFVLQPGQTSRQTSSGRFILPPGGHHIRIAAGPLPDVKVIIKAIAVKAKREISAESHALSLPFDLYQRYRFAGDLSRELNPSSILDAGGLLGDEDGHLAVSEEFFSSPISRPERITTADLRHCDHPGHVPASALSLPFDDRSFDLVASLDVLEHIPPDSRPRFMEELERVAGRFIILGAPFASAAVVRTEKELVSDLDLHFLSEHSALGLPEESLVAGFFGLERGHQIFRFENGYLPRWSMMLPLTQMAFALHEYSLFCSFNRYYNENYYPLDCSRPGYRTIFLICREPLTGDLESRIKALPGFQPEKIEQDESESDYPPSLPFSADYLKLIAKREKEISDLAFLLASREKYSRILEAQLRGYERNPLIRMIRKIGRRLWGGVAGQ